MDELSPGQNTNDQQNPDIPIEQDFAQLDPANAHELQAGHINISVVPATETAHLTLGNVSFPPVVARVDTPEQTAVSLTPVQAFEQQIKLPEASSRLGQWLERHPRTIRMTKVIAATALFGEAIAACSSGHTSAAQAPKSSISSYSPSSSTETINPGSTHTTPSHIPSVTQHPGNSTSESHSTPPGETHSQAKLPYQELPGYGKEASQADIERFQASQVEVLMRYQGSTSSADWMHNCMGTKVLIGGNTYILSAAHCLELPSDIADPNDPHQIPKSDKKPHPIDVTKDLVEQYGIRTAGNPGAPVVTINRIVEGQTDFDLMQIDPHDPHSQSYANIPAINYDDPMLTFNGSPINLHQEAGSKGFGSAITSDSNNKYISNPRVYLGRIEDPAEPGVFRDVWGETVTSRKTDSSDFGSSGSSSLGAGGWLSGPETGRDYIPVKGDKPDPYDTNPDPNVDNSLQNAKGYKASVDAILGFSTKNFNVLVTTTVVTKDMLHNAAAVFNTPAH